MTDPVRVRFVAAAGPSIGRGHLARALSLAEASWPPATTLELALEPATELTGRERQRLAATGGRRVDVDEPVEPRTAVVIDVPEPDSLADRFDHSTLAVFDDRESFSGAAAIVVQPSLPSWSGRASAGRVLAGFDLVPVAAEVRRRRGASSSARGSVSSGERPRVLVCFGGSDPDRITARLAPAIVSGVAGRAEIDVVIGASYTGPTTGWPTAPTRDPADLVDRLASAHLVVAGAGTMKFELACLGRPMLLVAAADDQRPVGPAFAATGAARYLGDGRSIDPDQVGTAVGSLLDDREARATLGVTAARVVDGGGADRLAQAFLELGQATGSS